MKNQLTRALTWLRTVDGLAYLALMAVALAVRVYVAPRVMVSYDVAAYAYWGVLANQDLFHVYSVGAHAPSWVYIPAYPPVPVYFYGLLDRIYFGLSAVLGIPVQHDVVTSHMLKLYLKMPGILADLALLTIMYTTALRKMPRWGAWLLSATYAFSPGVLITVLFWGQTDGLILLLVAGALIFAMRKQPIICGILLALAVNFKPQPIVFVPLALVYLWRWGSFRLVVRGAIAFIVLTIIIWLPYLQPPFGEIIALKNNITIAETTEHLTASHTAFNLWWMLGLAQQGISTPYYGPFTISQVGYAIFAVVVALVMIGILRDRRPVQMWAGAGIVALAFFTVTTLQFERYLFPALGLFFLAALYDRRYWLLYATLSITFMTNFEASLFSCQCDPITTKLSAPVLQALMFHFDGWQVGLINCLALVVSIVFFLWPRAEPSGEWSERRAADVLPMFGASAQPALAGAGASGALASAVAAGGARMAPATRPVMTGLGYEGRALFSSGAVALDEAQPDTVRMRALPQIETTSSATGPRLRLRPRNLGRPPYVSVVVPCYNEQGNIRPMYERLTAALTSITPTYEIVFVNNGSFDQSPEIFEEIASRDPRVSVVSLSRNFGSQGAYSAGYAYCTGECVVGLDGDIQDPPEMIPAFVAKWLEGYDVVYGIRARRKGSIPRRIGYKLFYRLLRKFSYVDMPVDASDFGLMDRRVVNVLNEMPERSRLIRGLRAFAGFSQTGIPYERAERYAGFTTNSFFNLFRWAGMGIISFSFAPLDLISYLAGVIVGLAALAMVVYTALYFIFPGAPRGYQTLLLVMLFLGAVQLLCLSIIGAYLGKIFEEVKARPRFLVNDIVNDHRAENHSA